MGKTNSYDNDDDFCIGELLLSMRKKRKEILKETCTLFNLYEYIIEGATKTEIFEYIIQFIKEQNEMKKVFTQAYKLSESNFTQEDFNNLTESQREAMNYAVNCGMVGLIMSIVGEANG